MTPQERAEKHWDCYVGPMQKTIITQMVNMMMEVSRFHYISSHLHGVKHEQQDARETARGALANAAAHKEGAGEISTFCGHYAPLGDRCTIHPMRGLAECGDCPDYHSVTIGATP